LTVAITGATGFVGQAVLDEAARQGIPIRALTRREQPSREGVEWVMGDLEDTSALYALAEGAEALIHIAGVVNAPDMAGFEAGNVTGTLTVIEAAVKARVPRFVFVSSLSARQPNLSDYGASKARAEKLVAASGLGWTTVRPPAIYGPRDREIFELFRTAKWGVIPMPPPGRASMIHADDLARLLLALREDASDLQQQVFEPDDGAEDGWSHDELAKAIGEAVGRKVWVPHLSKKALMRIAALDRFFRRGKAKLTPDRVNYMTHPDWVCSNRKQVPERLWTPQIETRAGLKSTAEWYRAQGWL
jgi:uncharacterized protein YbjT (DUF2867 family)